MTPHVIFIFVFLFFVSCVPALQASSRKNVVNNFALLDHDGKMFTLDHYRDQKAIVIVVQGNGCPIVRKSITYLNDLKKQFAGQDVIFQMINANPQDDRASIAKEAQDFSITWPILDDSAQVAATSLKIVRTAEAFIIDPATLSIVYRGPIHDKLGYGSERPKIKKHYLKDHLNAFLKGKPLDVVVPAVQGCLVNLSEQQELMFVKDIAPILIQRCFSCHSAGGVAPWQMDSYERVKGWGPMIREVVSTKRMPPWFVDPAHGEFKEDVNLSDAEVRALVSWVDQGMPRGEGDDPLRVLPVPERQEWTLGKPDLVFQFDQEQVIPSTGTLPIGLTYLTPPLEKDIWLKAVHMLPGNYRVVHHANVIAIDPAVLNDTTNVMEISGPQKLWYEGSGYAVPAGQIIAGYVPGYDVFEMPPDTGMFIPKGIRLGFFMHYVTTGREERDLTKLGLYLHDMPPSRIISVIDIHNKELQIPPGAREYPHQAEYTLDKEITLDGLSPHMHLRGKYMNVTAEYPTGEKEVLISVPYYRFSWQKQYFFKEPKVLPAGTKIVVKGAFDNSEHNQDNPDPKQAVKYGPQSSDEMFNAFLLYTREK